MKGIMKSVTLVIALALIGIEAPVAAAPAQISPAAVQREVLPGDARPIRYVISLAPNADAMRFAGKVKVDFEVVSPIDRVVMNAVDLTFTSASLAGDNQAPRITLEEQLQRVTITFNRPLTPGQYTLTVEYDGKIYESAAGLFAVSYDADGAHKKMLATQFEPGDARKLAPLWDEPAHKAVFELDVTIPTGQDAVSNMPIVSTTPVGAAFKRVQFAPTMEMSSYLLFLGIGELDRLASQVAGVEIGVVSKKGDVDKGRYALAISSPLLTYYNDYFGIPYPLPKLDHIAVPGAGGFQAMENWGAIMYFEPALLFDPELSSESDRQLIYRVVAHEMAHQWFGNLVTMSWWNDLWLNEGFASWMETKATDTYNPQWHVWLGALQEREQAMVLDALSATHSIVQTIVNIDQASLAFDKITYLKGQAVIRMLETYLGEQPFRDGVRAYMNRYAFRNTVTDDLWRELEAASQLPVVAIARDFTAQPGVPLIIVDAVKCINGQSVVSLHQNRFSADAPSRQPLSWHTPVLIRTVGAPGEGRVVVEGSTQASAPGCGPVMVNAGHTGYFRTLYPPAEFGRLKASFARLAPADQLGLLDDTWALGAAGYVPVENYLELAETIALDVDPVIWRQLVATFTMLHHLDTGRPAQTAFNAYARRILQPVFDHVGWSATPGEADNISLLREDLILALARFGDSDLIAEARHRFVAAETAADSLPPGLRTPVLRVVAMHADADAWERLRAKAKTAASRLEQQQYLNALTYALDPALARRTLELALSDETPKQLGPNLIRSVAAQHPDLAWAFMLANKEALDARLDPSQRLAYAPAIASASNEVRRADDLRAYAEENIPADARTSSEVAIAEILFSSKVRTERLPAIDRWLSRHGF